MIIPFLIATLSAASNPDATDPVRLWINSDRSFRPGEAVKVQVETERGGYLLVLHVAPDGRVSVLFPVSPQDDALVEAGRRYELRDDRGNVTFVAAGPGQGLVYSALAEDPWLLSSIRNENGWDYGKLSIDQDSKNPEAELTALLEPLATERGYDYDILDYVVLGGGYDHVPATTYIYDDGWGCYSCGYWGPSAIYIGFGWPYGYPGWPWYFGHRHQYRYGFGYGYGYYGRPWYWGYSSYPYYRYPRYVPVHYGDRRRIIGRPRGYTVGTGSTGTRGVRGDFDGTRSDRDRASRARPRGGDQRTPVTRPSDGGSRATGSDAGRNSGGERSRARGESNGRSRGGRGNSELQNIRPNVERARPESRVRGSSWVRDGEAPVDARRVDRNPQPSRQVYIERSRGSESPRSGARRAESSAPVYVERSRGSSRQVERVENSSPRRAEVISAPRSGGERSYSRPRESGSSGRVSQPRPSSQSQGSARAHDSNRGSRASAPSRGGGGSRANSSGGSRGGGGGGRSRGGRP